MEPGTQGTEGVWDQETQESQEPGAGGYLEAGAPGVPRARSPRSKGCLEPVAPGAGGCLEPGAPGTGGVWRQEPHKQGGIWSQERQKPQKQEVFETRSPRSFRSRRCVGVLFTVVWPPCQTSRFVDTIEALKFV